MNMRLLHILFSVSLLSYHVINTSDSPQPPILPDLTELTPDSSLQFGTYGQPKIQKGDPTHEEEQDDSEPSSRRFGVQLSPQELETLGKPTPLYWTMCTEEELELIDKHHPDWKKRGAKAETDQAKALYDIQKQFALLKHHKACLKKKDELTKERKKVESELKELSEALPGELIVFLDDSRVYEDTSRYIELHNSSASLKSELKEQIKTISLNKSKKEVPHLTKLLRDSWSDLGVLMVKNSELKKKATQEKIKTTGDPSATLTDKEFSELILAERFSYLVAQCSGEDEAQLLKELFSKAAEIVSSKKDNKPEESPPLCPGYQVDPETAAHLEAMRTVQKILYAEAIAKSIEETLSTGDFAKIPTIFIKLKQVLRILASSFPEADAATTSQEAFSSKPLLKKIEEDFSLEDEDPKEVPKSEETPSEEQTEQPSEQRTSWGSWVGLT